jgi:hypothetical protein
VCVCVCVCLCVRVAYHCGDELAGAEDDLGGVVDVVEGDVGCVCVCVCVYLRV